MALMHFNLMGKLRLLWRSFFIQVFWNYHEMQGQGFLFALFPFLRRLESDPEKRKRLIGLSTGFMNTHPGLAPLAMGALLRRMAGDEDLEKNEWQAWRESLCGPLGTMGDTLIWSGLKPLVFVIAVAVMLLFGAPQQIYGLALLFLVLYNVPLLGLRFWGLQEGWRRGPEVLRVLERPLFVRSKTWIDRIGAMFFGVLLIVGFAKTSLFTPLAMVQFGVGFALLWISSYANWPLISSLFVVLGFVPFSSWLMQFISTVGH